MDLRSKIEYILTFICQKGDSLPEAGYCSASKEGHELVGLFKG